MVIIISVLVLPEYCQFQSLLRWVYVYIVYLFEMSEYQPELLFLSMYMNLIYLLLLL